MADIRFAKYRGQWGSRLTIRGEDMQVPRHHLLALVLLGLSSLLALCARSVGRDGALKLGRLSDTLALLALLRLVVDGGAVLGVVVGKTLLFA